MDFNCKLRVILQKVLDRIGFRMLVKTHIFFTGKCFIGFASGHLFALVCNMAVQKERRRTLGYCAASITREAKLGITSCLKPFNFFPSH